ncbi:FeoB-associated Cys-rich membrane protein [Cetobacterium sp.]|uniref:FeoB-associated Cys-rich membrane protein n=1 Tax=Cetobacterium sp. TaxID=2071632 RepID=UPI002FCB6A36
MKTIILIAIVAVIGAVAIRSLYKMLKGESGCNCSKGTNGSCSFKDKCNKK